VNALSNAASSGQGARSTWFIVGNEPATATTRVAYDMISEGFGPGTNGPLFAVVDTPDATAQERLTALSGQLEREPGVASVGEPQPSPSGTTTMVPITPTTSPQDDATVDLIERLRDGPLATSGLQVDLGGATAATVDQSSVTANRLPLFIGGVIGLSFLLLLVAFRAPIVAAKAGVLNCSRSVPPTASCRWSPRAAGPGS
jgi:RND superfamily putative drug exporter